MGWIALFVFFLGLYIGAVMTDRLNRATDADEEGSYHGKRDYNDQR